MHCAAPRASLFLVLVCLLALAGRARAAAAGEGAPVDATVFFSPDEKKWEQTRRLLEDAVRAYPRLRMATVSLLTDEGQRSRASIAEKWRKKLSGDVTFAMGPFHLENKGDDRQIDRYLMPLLRRVFNPDEGKGRLDADPRAFAVKVFGAKADVEPITAVADAPIRYYRVSANGKAAGFVADAFRVLHCPMCNDTQFLIALGLPEQKILSLEPVRPIERWGRDLEPLETAAFIRKATAPPKAAKDDDADAISGATKTFIMYQDMLDDIQEYIAAHVVPQPADASKK